MFTLRTLRLAAPVVLGTILASTASAQTIAPSSAATKNSRYWNTWFFYSTTRTKQARTQTMYSEADLGSKVLVLKNVQVRRPQVLGNQNKAMSGKAQLIMSSSKVAPSNATSTYANNHGKTTVVLNGAISLPPRNRGASWPDPWETAFAFNNTWIFVPVKGGSLVLENIFQGGATHTTPWYLEGHRKQAGTRTTNLSACPKHSDGGRNNSIGHRNPEVGGSFLVNYNSMPSNVPSLKASFQILGLGGRGAKLFGLTLPIRLSTLNIPSANSPTGCQLAVTDDIRLPLTYRANTSGAKNRGSLNGVSIPIPRDPKLAGLSFYDQGIAFDTNATTKRLEIYTTWSSKWTIGSGLGEPLTQVYRVGNNTTATGFVRKFEGPTMRFNQ